MDCLLLSAGWWGPGLACLRLQVRTYTKLQRISCACFSKARHSPAFEYQRHWTSALQHAPRLGLVL